MGKSDSSGTCCRRCRYGWHGLVLPERVPHDRERPANGLGLDRIISSILKDTGVNETINHANERPGVTRGNMGRHNRRAEAQTGCDFNKPLHKRIKWQENSSVALP